MHAGSCPHPPTAVHSGQSQGVSPEPGLISGLPPGARDGDEVLVCHWGQDWAQAAAEAVVPGPWAGEL